MFFSYNKNVFQALPAILLCALVLVAQHACASSNKQAAAFIGAGTLTTVAQMSVEHRHNYHGFLKCTGGVFLASLASIVVADRLYNGDWDLLRSLLHSCGLATDEDFATAKRSGRGTTAINDDFTDLGSDDDDDSDGTGDDAGACCSGCCHC